LQEARFIYHVVSFSILATSGDDAILKQFSRHVSFSNFLNTVWEWDKTDTYPTLCSICRNELLMSLSRLAL